MQPADKATIYRPRRPALARTLAEAAALPLRARPAAGMEALLARAPRGDGHAVLVMPTSLNGDPQTQGIRNFLGKLGYRAFGWELGVNFGPTARVVSGMPERLAALADSHGKVSLVGFSMGGLFARWLAVRWPDRVRGIVTVCSPFRAPTESLFLPLEPLVDAWPGPDLRALAEEVARPIAGPATFIYSRDDGIVAWASCCDPDRPSDNVETFGPHVTIAENLDVFRIVAERLARPG
jgi:pimeloyl-ACP methyl ester carboxylesterase